MGKIDLKTNMMSGTINGMVYYSRNGKQCCRKSPVFDKQKYLKDPQMAPVRNQVSEFKIMTHLSKMFFDSVQPCLKDCKDSGLFYRLNKLMSDLRNMDTVSEKGCRSPKVSLANDYGKEILKGFDFNDNVKLNSVLFWYANFNVHNGAFIFEGFNPKMNIDKKKNYTHFSMMLYRVDFDLSKDEFKSTFSNTYTGSLKDDASTITLQLEDPQSDADLQIFLLKISFLYEMNGVLYPLPEKEFNACKIIEVK
jgi:hypothetical protein